MRNLTGYLAVGAFALAGFSTVTALGLARDLRARDATPAPTAGADAHAALEERLGALELALMLTTTGVGGKPPPLPNDPRIATTPESSEAGRAGTGLAAAPKLTPSLEDMARRLADLERQLAERRTEPAVVAGTDPVEAPAPADAFRYIASVDDAEKHLELTPSQKSDLELLVADVSRERDALHRLPGENGKTWEETAQESMKLLGNGVFQYDGEALAAFRETQVPGRSESFGAADRRITQEARRRVEASLTPDQRKRLEKSNLDGLLGGSSGGGMSFSLSGFQVQAPLPTEGK